VERRTACRICACKIQILQADQLAEKLNFLSFRGALRAEESLSSCV
jgi:hypothetical protein